MINIGIVVLHYKTIEDTKKCVDSFLSLKVSNNQNVVIKIVDNYSNNGSFEELKNIYKDVLNVEVVSTMKNVGFAKGNNFGINLLLNENNFDYYICSNNDIYIEDSDFFIKMMNYEFDVMGPDIIRVSDLCHQNPTIAPSWSMEKINKRILEFRVKIFIFTFLPFLMKKNKKNNIKHIESDFSLHGSFLIFSKNYINKFKNAFYDGTFLYLEEDFIYYRCKNNNLIMKYCDDLIVYHNHSSSTRSTIKNEKKRRIFFLTNQINSLKELKKYLREGGEK